ncbi:hypothetical protein DYB34_002469 [Aphanomyces astaci]|uniref:Core Histone H2A/H2B/H3 domain-containing protein n=1 Tax=Aphanomyces astaci TaxID=112090 RepID=A0A3R7AIG5_APHAT|nr:hypothetical protein DYB34_002469 [Aphanomyces astaci]
MISAEAPVLFAKACEMFILELSLRAWIHTEENKRRTLQRNDIAMAITKTDTFDFLIDIVPREDIKLPGKKVRLVLTMMIVYSLDITIGRVDGPANGYDEDLTATAIPTPDVSVMAFPKYTTALTTITTRFNVLMIEYVSSATWPTGRCRSAATQHYSKGESVGKHDPYIDAVNNHPVPQQLQYVSSLDAMASTLSGSNRSSLQGCCSPSKIVPMTKWHTVRSSADMPCSLISVLLMNVALVENVYQHNM